jgi:hypothetical protein
MAKVPSKNSVAIETMPGLNGGKLRRGNPGNQGGTGRPTNASVLRARQLVEQRKIIEHVADIADGTYMETRAIRVLQVKGQLVKELVQAPPRAAVQVSAAVALMDRAAPRPPTEPGDGDEQVQWYVALPKRARTTREWMKMHGITVPPGHRLKGDKG